MTNILSRVSKTVAIDAVREYPDNPRLGDLAAIKKSIVASGFYTSLTVQKSTGFILAGNHRWLAAIELGFTEIPIEEIDVDDDEARRIVLNDNEAARRGDFDNKKLAALVQQAAETDPSHDALIMSNTELVGLLKQLEGTEPSSAGSSVGGGSPSGHSSGSAPSGPGEPPVPPPGNGYKEQYGVIIICEDEEEQEDVFNRLKADNYNCRIVNT